MEVFCGLNLVSKTGKLVQYLNGMDSMLLKQNLKSLSSSLVISKSPTMCENLVTLLCAIMSISQPLINGLSAVDDTVIFECFDFLG